MIDALTRLHYGSPYLDAVIRSTEGLAERHWVVYTDVPNFPGTPTIPCPDTREQLFEIATIAGGDRLRWIDHPAPGVSVVLNDHPEIGLLVEVDSDEVIHQDLAADIRRKYLAGELLYSRYRVPMCHHWRSFRHVCHDGQWPIRLYLPHAEHDEVGWYPRMNPERYFHHFGYTLPRVFMEYKWMLSIHRPELRPEWWAEIYDCWPERRKDVHPVSVGMWDVVEMADSELPACLITHPYRTMEVIE